ncbi:MULTISPECIES: FAD-dependent oxidoreductase [unclassified Leclercia]|uniref:FAD-dependent oxidoreductase n=1 Tax=Leclercia barmai TaxID=2785629 RepID=A0ABS7RYW9_9ENTR|nr:MULTISPECIES: FAD-dependent oxidoreductase [unclassified Leclercia]MBZ0059500.1 FAD-dependent oxidoreductase [Leclercia sp. EMC7]MCM5697368.1 FAD-dependent oxidoreductase [Leclercia sp. LTM01]MCM5702038.1 FAD-dependent oxidoreductase [Leclercia sp. LTM14]
MTINKVLIVGGGIGGLCAAIALRRVGISADLVEIQSEWRVYGVGIIQQNNVVREMQRLGVLERYLDVAWPFDKVSLHTMEGHPLANFPGERLAGAQFPANVGISRLKLHEVLCSTAEELGTTITTGKTVDAFEQDEHGVDVVFNDQTTGRYDLLIGADGIYSMIRGQLYGNRFTPRFTGQGVWRYNLPRPAGIDHLMCFISEECNCGLVPLAEDLMYLFVTSHEPENPRFARHEFAEQMRCRIPDCGGMISDLRHQIVDDGQVVYKPLEELFVDAPWFENRVVLIGDAVHATTPHLGQGAGMAIEDALVLAETLHSDDDIQRALSNYYLRRRDRCYRIWRDSLRVGESEINNDPLFDRQSVIRDMMMFTARPI